MERFNLGFMLGSPLAYCKLARALLVLISSVFIVNQIFADD